MDALKQLERLIDVFIDEATDLKDKVRIIDTDVWAEGGHTVTDSMILENEKTIEVLEELDDILSSLNDLSYDISSILNWKD